MLERSEGEEFDFESRIVSSGEVPGDGEEVSLRPKRLDEYVGQNKVKENLKVYMEAAKSRKESLDHVLLYGPPGLGKTTLSAIIAEEMGVNLRITSGPAIERPGDLVAQFTLIGATTRAGQLSTPLRDRFGVIFKLELYSPEELAGIVRRSAGILGLPISEDGALEIASRSRGTPRIANRFLKRVRDFAQVMGNGTIDRPIADYALRALEVDELGLDAIDRRMLQTIIKAFGGGPVGLDTLAATVGEEAVTIEDVYEPYLMQIGFLNRTPRGRCVTALAYEHLGLPLPGPGGRPEENASGQINVFGEE